MTLIYAERVGTQVAVWSDTAITNENASHLAVIPDVLKSIIISHELCVSFSGSVTGCLDVIRSVSEQYSMNKSLEIVLGILKNHTGSHSEHSEFLVVFNERLVKIKDGNLFEGCASYWIGDARAASEFLFQRDGMLRQGAEIDQSNSRSFDEVLKNSTFPGVAGIPFQVVRRQNGYTYNLGVVVEMPKSIPAGATVKVESRGAAIGGNSYTFVVPREAGKPFVGLYFPPATYGFIYSHLDHDEPVSIQADTLEAFTQRVEHEYQTEFHSVYIT
jgi:hypothetical protein